MDSAQIEQPSGNQPDLRDISNALLADSYFYLDHKVVQPKRTTFDESSDFISATPIVSKESRVLNGGDQCDCRVRLTTDIDAAEDRDLKNPKLKPRLEKLREMEATFNRVSDKLDINHDGALNLYELNVAAQNPELDAGAKYMVEFMRRGYSPLLSWDKGRRFWISDLRAESKGLTAEGLKQAQEDFDIPRVHQNAMYHAVAWSAAFGATFAALAVGAAPLGPLLGPVLFLGPIGTVKVGIQTFYNNVEEHSARRHQAWEVFDSMEPEKAPTS